MVLQGYKLLTLALVKLARYFFWSAGVTLHWYKAGMHSGGPQALLVAMLHVHDAKQSVAAHNWSFYALFILLFGLVMTGLVYMAYPDGCQHRCTVMSRLRPYPMRWHWLSYTALYTGCVRSQHCMTLSASQPYHACAKDADEPLHSMWLSHVVPTWH